MDVLKAMKETLDLCEGPTLNPLPDELQPAHLLSMYQRACDGEFSYGKLCRWLGWMQAAVVAHHPLIELEQMKEINRRCS